MKISTEHNLNIASQHELIYYCVKSSFLKLHPRFPGVSTLRLSTHPSWPLFLSFTSSCPAPGRKGHFHPMFSPFLMPSITITYAENISSSYFSPKLHLDFYLHLDIL